MANITRGAERTELPVRRFDPYRMMRDMMRWDPFGDMETLAPAARTFIPSFEVKETKDAYVFKGDLPGVREQDLSISLTGNRLTVSGERNEESRTEEESFYAYERAYGNFSRSFTLPSDADLGSIQADMKNGVLELHVPKRAEAQPRKIEIGGRAQQQQPKGQPH